MIPNRVNLAVFLENQAANIALEQTTIHYSSRLMDRFFRVQNPRKSQIPFIQSELIRHVASLVLKESTGTN